MGKRPRFNYFLVHQETGQRYPVGDEIVLGRVSGHVLFPDDPKVSNQHCRILNTPQGLAVHDFESSNGTTIDGIKLNPKKIYVLKPDSVIALGHQQLKLQKVSHEKILRRRARRKKRHSGFDLPMTLAGVVALTAAVYLTKPYWQNLSGASDTKVFRGEIETPLQIVEREMRAAFAEYTILGRDNTAGRVTDKELSQAIRQKLIPRLNAARAKMEVLRPQNEWETQKIDANKKLLSAVIGQVTAMANYTDTKSPNYSAELERMSALVETINAQVQKLDDLRRPASY